MTGEYWATIAAFTAAGLSLANVAIAARLTSHSERTQWRRTLELEAIADIIKSSDSFIEKCWNFAEAMDRYEQTESHDEELAAQCEDIRAEASALYQSMVTRKTELQVIASQRMVEATEYLATTLEVIDDALNPNSPRFGPGSKVDTLSIVADSSLDGRYKFLLAARIEFGADRRGAIRTRARRRFLDWIR